MAEEPKHDDGSSAKDIMTRLWWQTDAALSDVKKHVREIKDEIKASFSRAGVVTAPSNGTAESAKASSHCTDNSVSGSDSAHVNYNRIDVGERTWSVIAVALGALAIGLAILAIVLAQLSERETKLAREDIRVMSIALAHHGIDTDEHAIEKGDKP